MNYYKKLLLPFDPSKAKIFRLLFGREPLESDLIITFFLDHFPTASKSPTSSPCRDKFLDFDWKWNPFSPTTFVLKISKARCAKSSFHDSCLDRSLSVRSADLISLSAIEDGERKSASRRLALAPVYDLANIDLQVCFLLLLLLLKGHINWFLTSHGWGNEPFSRQNSPYK